MWLLFHRYMYMLVSKVFNEVLVVYLTVVHLKFFCKGDNSLSYQNC